MQQGAKYSEHNWIHVSIWIKQNDWQEINYLSSASGKTLSAWCLDKLKNYEGIPPVHIANKDDVGRSKSLCFPEKEWEQIKQKADAANMRYSQYVINVLFA